MNHEAAVAGEFARRYLADALAEKDAEAFEDHLIDCTICQREIATDELMRRGFREAEVRPRAVRSPPAWLRTYAIAASTLLVVSVGWGVWLQSARVSAPEEDLDLMAAAAPVRLATTRAGVGAPDAVLQRAAGASGWLLEVDVPTRCSDGVVAPVCADGERSSIPLESEYDLTVRAPTTGAAVFTVRKQRPLSSGAVVFYVPHAALPPGDYLMDVSGRAPVARFHVVIAPLR